MKKRNIVMCFQYVSCPHKTGMAFLYEENAFGQNINYASVICV